MSTTSTRAKSIAATLVFGLGLAGAAVAQAQTNPVAPDVQRSISTSTPNQTDNAVKAATPATPAAPKAGTAAVPASPAAPKAGTAAVPATPSDPKAGTAAVSATPAKKATETTEAAKKAKVKTN